MKRWTRHLFAALRQGLLDEERERLREALGEAARALDEAADMFTGLDEGDAAASASSSAACARAAAVQWGGGAKVGQTLTVSRVTKGVQG